MPKIFIFDIDKEELIIPKISLEINQEEKKIDVKNQKEATQRKGDKD